MPWDTDNSEPTVWENHLDELKTQEEKNISQGKPSWGETWGGEAHEEKSEAEIAEELENLHDAVTHAREVEHRKGVHEGKIPSGNGRGNVGDIRSLATENDEDRLSEEQIEELIKELRDSKHPSAERLAELADEVRKETGKLRRHGEEIEHEKERETKEVRGMASESNRKCSVTRCDKPAEFASLHCHEHNIGTPFERQEVEDWEEAQARSSGECQLCSDKTAPGTHACKECLGKIQDRETRETLEHEKLGVPYTRRTSHIRGMASAPDPNPLARRYAELIDKADELERRVIAVEEQIETRAGTLTQNGDQPMEKDFLFEFEHEPGHLGGVVVDDAVARMSPCHRMKLNGGALVFSKGIVGALDEGQQELYCPETVDVELTPQQKKRYENFKDAVVVCQTEIQGIPKGERLSPWLRCMSREAKKKGIELK